MPPCQKAIATNASHLLYGLSTFVDQIVVTDVRQNKIRSSMSQLFAEGRDKLLTQRVASRQYFRMKTVLRQTIAADSTSKT